MKCEGWISSRIADMVEFNPRESIPKNRLAKKVAMEKLSPHQKVIDGYELGQFTGGTKFRNGDTLLARITPCLENGKTAKVSILEDNEVGFGSTEFIALRNKPGMSDSDFIYYIATSPAFRDIAIKSMVGTSGRQRIQQDSLENTVMNFPPLPEQRAIAATLSCLDDKIELNNRMNKTLEEMAQAIFKSWFVDFEPFQGSEFVDSELGRIPKGWRVGTLTEIADFLNGLAMQKYRPTEGEMGLPVLKIKELGQARTDSNSDICTSKLDAKYIVHDGDIIFSWSGTLLVDIWCGGTCGLNQHLFKVTSKTHPKWYIYFWTKSHLVRFQAIARDKATTMGHIKRGELDNSKVLIPDDKSMKKLNGTMMPLIDMLITNKVQSQLLEKTRDDLLPRLMNGEIRVPTNP